MFEQKNNYQIRIATQENIGSTDVLYAILWYSNVE